MKTRLAYQPGLSLLHQMHPLLKVSYMLLGTIALFCLPSPWTVLAILAAALAAFPLCRLHTRGVRGARLFATTALLLALLQLLFVHRGRTLFSLGPLQVTGDGLSAAVYVAGRFLAVILISYLFVLTTDPNDLAYALMQAGLPYRYGFTLVTALRLASTFEEEGQIVYRAQLARGVQYDVRSPRRFLTLGRQFFLPLLVSALGKVDSLAISMEGRCFGKYPTRTFSRQVPFTRRDAWMTAFLALLIAAMVAGIVLL